MPTKRVNECVEGVIVVLFLSLDLVLSIKKYNTKPIYSVLNFNEAL